jgi:hypothetical protein
MNQPNLFIVGAPKCGTSSLYYYLNQHADISMSFPKEPHFLAQDLGWQKGWGMEDREQYLNLFQSNARYRGEASTWYLYSDLARTSIKELFPDSKIIICIRHPANFIASLWWHLFSRDKETSRNLETALRLEPQIKSGKLSPQPAPFKRARMYKENARHSAFIAKYVETFGVANVKIILLEDLNKSTQSVLNEVFQFLGLRTQMIEDLEHQNAANSRAIVALYKIVSVPPLKALLSSKSLIPAKRYLTHLVYKCIPNKPQRPKVGGILWEKITQDMAGEIQSIENLLVRDLSHWKAPYSVEKELL